MRAVSSMVGIAVAAVWVLSAPAAAQSSEERTLSQPHVAPVRARLARTVETAEQRDLPASWLRTKVAEGIAKHVPPPRIAAAVEQLLERMHAGRKLLRAHASQYKSLPSRARRRLLRAAVDALQVGAPRTGLEALVRSATEAQPRKMAARRLRESLVAVAILGERQFPPEPATNAVRIALEDDGTQGIARLLRAARGMGDASPQARRRLIERVAEQGLERAGRDQGGVGSPGGRGDAPAQSERERGRSPTKKRGR